MLSPRRKERKERKNNLIMLFLALFASLRETFPFLSRRSIRLHTGPSAKNAIWARETHLMPNNVINSDSKKRRSFVALLFAVGYGERSVREMRYGGIR
jgi:hypothetical protein